MKHQIKLSTLLFPLSIMSASVLADDVTRAEIEAIKVDYETRISELENTLKGMKNQKKSSSVSSSFENSYLYHRSADGNFEMKIDGRIMLDIGYVDNDNDENELFSDNDVRRARLGFKTKFYKRWGAEFDIDFSGNDPEIKDLWISYNGLFTPNTLIKFGNHKPFFSMAESTTSRWYPFVETPMITDSLAPGRRLGLSGSYWTRPFFIGATVFGNALEDADLGIDCDDEELGLGGEDVLVDCDFEDPSTNQDYGEDERFGYAVRSAYRPMYTEDGRKVIHLGAGLLEGKPETSESGRDRVRFRANPESRVVRTRFVDAKINDVDSYQINYLEAAARFGQFTAQAEFFNVEASPIDRDEGDDFNGDGFYLQGSWFLWGQGRSYNFSDGEFGGVIPSSKRGELELVARYSEVDFNDEDAFDGDDGGEADSITLGVNWYANTNIVFRLNYSMVNLGDNADADGDFEDNDDLSIVTLRTMVFF